jgi:hypothetical protein
VLFGLEYKLRLTVYRHNCMLTLVLPADVAAATPLCYAVCIYTDKLLQTKLREKEIKEALKEKRQADKDGKEEVSPAGRPCSAWPELAPSHYML